MNAIALIIVRYLRSTIKGSAIPVGASRALTSRLLRHSAHFGDRCDGPVVGQGDTNVSSFSVRRVGKSGHWPIAMMLNKDPMRILSYLAKAVNGVASVHRYLSRALGEVFFITGIEDGS